MQLRKDTWDRAPLLHDLGSIWDRRLASDSGPFTAYQIGVRDVGFRVSTDASEKRKKSLASIGNRTPGPPARSIVTKTDYVTFRILCRTIRIKYVRCKQLKVIQNLHLQYFFYRPFRPVITLKQTQIAQMLEIIVHRYQHILCLLMLVQPTYNR